MKFNKNLENLSIFPIHNMRYTKIWRLFKTVSKLVQIRYSNNEKSKCLLN